MNHRIVHLLRLTVICCAMVLGLILSSPALAEPTLGQALSQPNIVTTPVGSAKELLELSGQPISKSLDDVKQPSLGADRLKQVADSINKKSFDWKQVDEKPNAIKVEIKLPKNSKPKIMKKGGLPVSDR